MRRFGGPGLGQLAAYLVGHGGCGGQPPGDATLRVRDDRGDLPEDATGKDRRDGAQDLQDVQVR